MIGLLHKNICRPLTRGKILSHEFPFGGCESCNHGGVSIETDSQVGRLHRFMRQNTGFDDSEKADPIDDAVASNDVDALDGILADDWIIRANSFSNFIMSSCIVFSRTNLNA